MYCLDKREYNRSSIITLLEKAVATCLPGCCVGCHIAVPICLQPSFIREGCSPCSSLLRHAVTHKSFTGMDPNCLGPKGQYFFFLPIISQLQIL